MPGYGQFCPVAQALEVLGERWTLLIIRELLCGSARFGEILNGVPLISRSLLSQRLKTLEEAGIVERRGRDTGHGFEYCLTAAGRELDPLVTGLGVWGQRWMPRRMKEDDLDPVLLMWDMRRNLEIERLPSDPTVVMFWFRDIAGKFSRYWLRIERPEVELCMTNPGFDVSLKVETTLRTMVEVWMGHRELRESLRSGAIELTGPQPLVRAFPRWLKLNSFARVELPGGQRAVP